MINSIPSFNESCFIRQTERHSRENRLNESKGNNNSEDPIVKYIKWTNEIEDKGSDFECVVPTSLRQITEQTTT